MVDFSYNTIYGDTIYFNGTETQFGKPIADFLHRTNDSNDRYYLFYSSSYLYGQAIKYYEWEIKDSNGNILYEDSGSFLSSINYTWSNNAGTYYISLTITDVLNNTSTITKVYNIPEVALTLFAPSRGRRKRRVIIPKVSFDSIIVKDYDFETGEIDYDKVKVRCNKVIDDEIEDEYEEDMEVIKLVSIKHWEE